MRSLRTLIVLAAHNLRANSGQAAYLALTLAVATAAWLTLAALGSPTVTGTGNSGAGIILRNGSQVGAGLPLRYAHRIETMQDARDMYWYGVQLVNCRAATSVPLYALGGPGKDVYLAQQKVPASIRKRWDGDPLGVIVSTDVVSECGWQAGQGVEPPSGMDAKGPHIALHIIGTFAGSSPQGLVHYDYIDRVAPGLQGKDKVVTYFASAGNPRNDEVLAARIEAAFAHDFPAINATTNATVQNAWARFGKVQQLLAFVLAAMLLCAASVWVSVLAHAAAQRRARFALLEVLGFGRATLFGALALELLATAVVAVLIGIGLERLTAHALARTALGFLAADVHVPPWAWCGLPAWLATLVLAALAWPAGSIARVRPADYRAL